MAGVSRTATAPGPKASIDQTVARKLLGARQQPLHIGLVQLDDFRDQQDLPRHAAAVDRRLHALVDKPLMRGVLIDHHQPVTRLRHDISLVNLRARRAERTIEQFGRGLDDVGARIGHRFADLEGGLRGFGEADHVAAHHRLRRRLPPVPARRRSGTEGGDGRAASGGRRAAAVARQRFLQRAHQQPAHEPAVAEAHLGLCRMHVDVDLTRILR